MTRWGFALAACLFASTISAETAPEPILQSAQMPKYPVIARLARVTGEVDAEFTLSKGGSVESVQIVSGPPLLAGATRDNIQTWKFRLPDPPPDPSRKYATKFLYRFSAHQLDGEDPDGPPLKLTVSVDTYHEVEITTDTYRPSLQH
jgi:TonB family protein